MNPGGNVHPNSPSTGHSHRPCNPSGASPPFQVESNCFHLAHRPLISYILWPTSVPGGKTNSGVTKCDREWYPAESKRRWTQPPTAYLFSNPGLSSILSPPIIYPFPPIIYPIPACWPANRLSFLLQPSILSPPTIYPIPVNRLSHPQPLRLPRCSRIPTRVMPSRAKMMAPAVCGSPRRGVRL